MTAFLRLLRPHQWAKNLLILAPALAAHRATDAEVLPALGLALLAFSLVASGLYVVNDVVDLRHDREHPTKRRRPIATGDVRPRAALAFAAVLIAAAGTTTALVLPRAFGVSLLVYAVLALGYSLGLKRAVLLDVILLAALYTVRVVAGAGAAGVPLSRWFLAFSVFVFLSLALVKRAVELRGLLADGKEDGRAPGRSWRVDDLGVLTALGVGSAVAGALVYCLYITSEDVLRLYASPDYLWLGLPLLLYWLGRVWILVARDEVEEDPVAFALRDPSSYAVAGLFALVVWLGA